MSAVGVFFSGVNATTIQYSYQLTPSTLSRAINLLWMLSLVFSIASAINSQIANHWGAAGYRSPQAYVPKFVALWMTHTPLLLLGLSVIAFSTGLVCFSFQVFGSHLFIPLVTALSTSVTSCALITVGLWLAGERYVASRHKRRIWLWQYIWHHLPRLLGVPLMKKAATWFANPPPSSTRSRMAAFFRSWQLGRRLRGLFSAARGLSGRQIPPPSRGAPYDRLSSSLYSLSRPLCCWILLPRYRIGLREWSLPRLASSIHQSSPTHQRP